MTFSGYDVETVNAAMEGYWPDYYSQWTHLRQIGDEWYGACPFHGGDGQSLSVNAKTGLSHCHTNCSKPGRNGYQATQEMEGCDFSEAVARVAQWRGLSPGTSSHLPRRPVSQRPEPKQAAEKSVVYLDQALVEKYHQRLMSTPKFLNWLKKHRGWTVETIQRFKIGLYGDPKSGYWRVTFPVYDEQGQVTNIRCHLFAYLPELTDEKRRELGKTKPIRGGLRNDLYPLSSLKGADSVLLVGGEPDAILGNQLGISTISGTSGEGTWKEAWTSQVAAKCVRIMLDNDEAGRTAALRIAKILHEAGVCVSIAQYPDGVKDLTEWVVRDGATADDLRCVIAEAVPFAPEPDSTFITSPPKAPPAQTPWPVLHSDAQHGLAWEIVAALDPHTEADLVGLLMQILTFFGNIIGRTAYYLAEADRHYGNLFMVLVGISSKGRKGSSLGQVRRLFAAIDPVWEGGRVLSGLSSGEGLIYAVRDPLERQEKNKKTGEMETVLVDAGVDDKRLLVIESEYASVLKQTQRDGNTLSPVVRNAWDTGKMQSMTKNSPNQATGAHVSNIGHITAPELRKDLTETETANGFGNRYLWVCVKRSKELPFGGDIESVNFSPLIYRLQVAITHAREQGRMLMDAGARAVWQDVYHDLSGGKPGLLGAVTGRAEAQTMRLALLHALLGCDTEIRAVHLRAALAVWQYCEASAAYVFGDSTGDRVADDILRALRERPEGMTREDIRLLFAGNQSSSRIGQALALLTDCGRIHSEKESAAKGRPAERWFSAEYPT